MDMDNVTIENMRASCLIDINEVSQLEPSHIGSIYSDRISETQDTRVQGTGSPSWWPIGQQIMIIFYTADITRVYAAVILVYSHGRAAVLRAAAGGLQGKHF